MGNHVPVFLFRAPWYWVYDAAMPLTTRLTDALGIQHPILCAPMAKTTGGALAAAVSAAGGLGLIGAGYGDADWLDTELRAAGNQRIGGGFITWSLAKQPDLLDQLLAHRPAAVMLSFGDPTPFAPAVLAAGAVLMCQVQSLAQAQQALDAGARVIVAQGAEAGGHGAMRGTMALVPDVPVLCAAGAPAAMAAAAGGIADGRGLAASLMLGAEGVLMGSRFWASQEAVGHPSFQEAAVAATGDQTRRSAVPDILRGLAWPDGYTIRSLDRGPVARWHGREADLTAGPLAAEAAAFTDAMATGDVDRGGVFVGEATGLIHDIPPAAEIVTRAVAQAEALLARAGSRITEFTQ